MRTARTRKRESFGRASRTRREARDSNISAVFDPSPPLQFRPIRTRRVFEEICEQVRRQMGAGTLRPGDKLPAERELALQFGVSRTAVREALRSLEIAGIVGLQKGAKGGAFILKGDLDQITRSIRDLFYLGRITLDSLTETRALIMQTAVGFVSQRLTPEILSALRENVDRLSKLPRASTPQERVEISGEFYDLIGKATQNDVLQAIIASLSEIVLQKVAERQMTAMPNLLEHRCKLVEFLAKHDVAAAQEEMGRHLQALHKHLVREEKLSGKK